MYQPLITFCPHPAIITQVLCIFVKNQKQLIKNRTLLLFVMAVLAAVGCNQTGRKDSEALRKSLDIADRNG